MVEGIGIYFSSGDNSDESLVEGYRTTDFPASSPFVTAVGGTTLAVGISNDYLFETAGILALCDATFSSATPQYDTAGIVEGQRARQVFCVNGHAKFSSLVD